MVVSVLQLLVVGTRFFFQAEDGIRDYKVTGVQTCALPISPRVASLRDAVTDERETRRAQRDQLVGVDGEVVRRPGAERGVGRAVFHVVPGHPDRKSVV